MQWYAATPQGGAAPDGAASDQAHRRAMEQGDDVLQQLAVAKYALTVADLPRAMAAIDAALGIARHSLSALLDVVCPPGGPSHAGALVRHDEATAVAPTDSGQPDLPDLPAPRAATY